jgi:hypothetical protein
MTGNAVVARWHRTSLAGQARMTLAGGADSPRRSLASWLLRRLGPPPLPPGCYFYRSLYSAWPTAGSRKGDCPCGARPAGRLQVLGGRFWLGIM